jgi:hypothetical protein
MEPAENIVEIIGTPKFTGWVGIDFSAFEKSP